MTLVLIVNDQLFVVIFALFAIIMFRIALLNWVYKYGMISSFQAAH